MKTEAQTFEILIKHVDGRVMRLSHRDRTEWKIRTAKKHLRDVVKMMLEGKRPEYKHAMISIA